MSIIFDTPDQINLARYITLLRGLKLEIDTGLSMSRGRTCYSIIKSEFNLKGNKKKVYQQLLKMMREVGVPITWEK
jgi:hypothetical protein